MLFFLLHILLGLYQKQECTRNQIEQNQVQGGQGMTSVPSQCCHESGQHMGLFRRLFILCKKYRTIFSVDRHFKSTRFNLVYSGSQVKSQKYNLLQYTYTVTTEAFKQQQYCCKTVRCVYFLRLLLASSAATSILAVSSNPDREIVNIRGCLIKYCCMWKSQFRILN